MILFKDITKFYPPHLAALKKINLEIKKGEFVSIVGRSGAGKTTLLRLLTREEKPSEGEVFIEEKKLSLLKAYSLPILRRRIGNIFQDFKLLPRKTIFENVSFAMEVAGFRTKEIKERVPRILEVVGIRSKMENFPHQLSAGEKQRVAIARALIHRPEILLADEPTGNLDLLNSLDIVKLLIKINQLGTTVILATHDREIINNLARRVVTLEGGKLIRDEEKGRYIM